MMWSRQTLRPGIQTLALSGALALALPPHGEVTAEDGHEHHHHQTQSADTPYQTTTRDYALPDLVLVRADGTQVHFPADIDDGRPVLLNFIYTTCTAICPMLSQTFEAFQARLGPEVSQVHMVSVSIDPEQDTPARLAEYAARYNAGPQWTHYTGTLEASIALQKAFDAYYGDKMNHRPVAFLRRAPGQPWLRLDGFTTPDDLVREYQSLLAGG
jgi:protein SCO1/2